MHKLHRTLVPFAIALALGVSFHSTQANASAKSSRPKVCFIDPETKEGTILVSLIPSVATGLVNAFPEQCTLFQAQEDCNDDIDNNCDGQVNEGCPANSTISDEDRPWIALGPGPRPDRCDICASEHCSDEVEECIASEACLKGTRCAADTGCMDPELGILPCVCGENASVEECAAIDNGVFKGKCAQAMQATSCQGWKTINQWYAGTWELHFTSTLHCISRFCTEECSVFSGN